MLARRAEVVQLREGRAERAGRRGRGGRAGGGGDLLRGAVGVAVGVGVVVVVVVVAVPGGEVGGGVVEGAAVGVGGRGRLAAVADDGVVVVAAASWKRTKRETWSVSRFGKLSFYF